MIAATLEVSRASVYRALAQKAASSDTPLIARDVPLTVTD
jgi:hypothetical protein